MNTDDPIFGGLQPPAPPDGLREAALAAALAAFPSPSRPDLWTRLLASRAARVAWAASVAALAAANLLVPRGGPRPAREVPSTAAQPDPELAAIARLPRVDERALPAPQGGQS